MVSVSILWVGPGRASTLCVGRLRLNGDYLHPIPNLGGYLQYILECLLTLFYFEEYDHKNFFAIDALQKLANHGSSHPEYTNVW